MRKLLAMVLALMLLCGAACAEHTVTHHMSEWYMSITVPGDYIVLTEDAPEGLFDSCNMEKESTVQWFHDNDTYMVIFDMDEAMEIDVSMVTNAEKTFNTYSKAQLEALVDPVGQQLESLGVKFDGGESFTAGGNNYLRLYYHIPGDESTTYTVQYYTVQNNLAFNFRMFTYGAEADAAQKQQMESVMNTVTFD